MPVYVIDNKLAGTPRCWVLDSAPLHVVALVALLATAPVFEALRVSAFSNRDLWWHLRSGLWILQNHSVPRSGLFSQYADRPWVASSWAFEALMAAAYKLLGLRAVPILLMAFKLALAVVTFLLARGWRGVFSGAGAVEAGFQPAIAKAVRPWLRGGYFYSSGDNNPNDGTHGTFFAILPTPRVYARFPFFNEMNNRDLFGELMLRPTKALTLRSDVHGLW